MSRVNPRNHVIGRAVHLFVAMCLLSCFGDLSIAAALPSDLRLHPLFSDHMVLQRDVNVPIFGHGVPGATVKVRIEGIQRETQVRPDGSWELTMPPFQAGGPKSIEALTEGASTSVSDVWFGDVWLASGQSNMEWKIGAGVLHQEETVAGADVPEIRFFTVPKTLSDKPVHELIGGSWKVSTSDSILECSAVPWFFAREVFKATGVPIGIIVSAVGGTPIESWMSPQAMQRFPNPKQEMVERLNKEWGSWTRRIEPNECEIKRLVQQVDESMEAVRAGVLEPEFDDEAWRACDLFEPPPVANCIRWMRKTVHLDRVHTDLPFTVSLARPAENLTIFINGKKAAELRSGSGKVELPPDTFSPGQNLIVLRIGNYWGVPHIAGDAGEVYLQSEDSKVRVPLFTDWKVSDTMEPSLAKWLPLADIPSCLFNGMIHPMSRSPIKGVIWYQGESNTSAPESYEMKFSSLISDWRVHFRQGYFPFYFVQLANFGAPSELPTQDGWAMIREAQAACLRLPETGMATAIDIGEALDIHPRNKEEVGRRLALQALAGSYGFAQTASGPRFRKLEVADHRVLIHLDHAERLASADGGVVRGFSLAGENRRFHAARARIKGECIELWSPEVQEPVAARYGFSTNPVATLVNGAGLPALPFRTDSWREIVSPP